MRKQFYLGLLVGGGLLLAGQFAAVAEVPLITLAWDYPRLDTNIVFNVYGCTNLGQTTDKWQLLTNSTITYCKVPAPPGNFFYMVTASNKVTGLESGLGY